MAKHMMNKREVKAMKLRKSKYFVTLENEKGNIPKSYLFPEKNTFPFRQEAERRRETIVAYYGHQGNFISQDMKIVEHGKLPFTRAFREWCRLNMVTGSTILSDVGLVFGIVIPLFLLLMAGGFSLLGVNIKGFLDMSLVAFLMGLTLWTVSVPLRAVFQTRKTMKKGKTSSVYS